MNKFKIGDLVKRIADPCFDYRYMISGGVYTVSGLPEDDYDSIEVNNLTERWDHTRFELYQPEQLEPTDDLQSELTEAYAKIDTLESALEDAVKELLSLKHQLIARAADTCLGIEKNTAVIDVNQGEFKPINEMTLEDWVEALDGEWQFLLSDGHTDSLNEIDYTACGYPVGMKMSGWKTLDGFDTYNPEYRDDYDVNIIKRIK